MTAYPRPLHLAPLVVVVLGAALVAGCVGGGSGFLGRGGDTTQASQGGEITPEEAAALRRLRGPGYCPQIVTPRGGEVLREYAEDHDGDPGFVVWQASLSETARECENDGLGTLTIRIGVSGRVVIGPAGQPATYTVPLQISVEKFQEATLTSGVHPLEVTVGPQGSVLFRQVYTVSVPSPGDRDYLINVGFQKDDDSELPRDESNV